MPTITLTNHSWTLGKLIDSGGFATVYEASSETGGTGAVKLIPKDPNAGRDLLFADLAAVEGVPNVVPILDRGETETHWALVMPLADRTLRHVLNGAGALELDQARPILNDVLSALAALDGKVVHRDIKPENVLEVAGEWCLADFGIARYAEATTAPDTLKHSMTAPYAAPEQWRSERASAATDIYALGVMAFELLAGTRPFSGPRVEDFREQHLHEAAPLLSGDTAVAALIADCLAKPPQARPRADRVQERLMRIGAGSASGAVERLREINLRISGERAAAAAKAEQAKTEQARREDLYDAASMSLQRILDAMERQVRESAPNASHGPIGWPITLGRATFDRGPVVQASASPWGAYPPAFDVVAFSALELKFPEDAYGYSGRSCSLWYCDAIREGEYRWYEVAFMVTPMIPKRTKLNPVAIPPNESSGVAVSNVMGEWQLAWPFTPIDQGDHDEFVERWLRWFADAADGRLRQPSRMPERETRGYRSR